MFSKIVKGVKVYIKRKDRETEIKKRSEKIDSIVKAILTDKTPKQAIEMYTDVTSRLDGRLGDILRENVETVESIKKYKNL
jgi:hypothetical protein